MAERRLLLAGSVGPERIPVRRDRDDADWFKPPHVRDEQAARNRIAGHVAAGADVVMAPTWLTHRRALLPLGETRQARAWTAAAVRVVRDGVEIGLERREEALAEVPEDDVRLGRPTPLIAASLPALDQDPEPGIGQLLPREAATERDYRDQAGLLADAEPDLLLVEGQATEAEVRIAIDEAVDTGLPTWASLGAAVVATTDLEEWFDHSHDAGIQHLVLPPPATAAWAAAEGDLPWGGVVRAASEVADWLDAGASVVARLDGASPQALLSLREAIDEFERAELEIDRVAEARWWDLLSQAAAIAPGGAALWLGSPPTAPLPEGFEWTEVDADEMRSLPLEHYRLIAPRADLPLDLAPLLERGGVLVAPPAGVRRGDAELRLLVLNDTGPPLAIYRRES
jgi:hypothetical protein